MSSSRLLGVALLVGGIILLIVGISSSDSIADQTSEFFTGKFTDSTMWTIIGGAVLAAVGLFLTLAGRRSGRT